MKTARISLAIASGTLLGLGYIVCAENEIGVERVLVGVLFGAVNSGTMIANPQQVSRKVLYYVAIPLMVALMVYVALTGPLVKSVVVIAVGIAFVAVQLALCALPVDPTIAAEPRGGRFLRRSFKDAMKGAVLKERDGVGVTVRMA